MSETKRYKIIDIPDRDKESEYLGPSISGYELLNKLKELGLEEEAEGLMHAKEAYDLSTKALYLSIGALIVSLVAGVIALIKLYS